jgi:hypothetical protein
VAAASSSVWRIPLAREIAAVVVLKLAVLLVIKSIWFSAPVIPADAAQRIDGHLLGTSGHASPSLEESPR